MTEKVHYKYCIVPKCTNTTFTSPNKIFICVPRDSVMRKKWCNAMKRCTKKNNDLSSKSTRYCCEDHFNLQEDAENYMQFKIMKGRLLLKKNVIPHIFECQKPAKTSPRPTGQRRSRTNLIIEAMAECSRPDVDFEPMIDIEPGPESYSLSLIKPELAPEGYSPKFVKPEPEPEVYSPTFVKLESKPESYSPIFVKSEPESYSPTFVKLEPESYSTTLVKPEPESYSPTFVKLEPEPEGYPLSLVKPEGYSLSLVKPEPEPEGYSLALVKPEPAPEGFSLLLVKSESASGYSLSLVKQEPASDGG